MSVPRTRFGFRSRIPRRRDSHVEIFRPTLGVHAGEPPEDLPPGATPESRNLISDDGWLVPRSKLSQYGGFSAEDPILGGTELPDVEGDLSGVASSRSSIFYIHPSTDSWSELSYIRGSIDTTTLGNFLTSDDLPSGLSTDYFDISPIYDAISDEFIAVLSNGTNFTKFFTVSSDASTYSDYTWAFSLDSTKAAQSLAAINDRIVFFNTTSSAGTKFPTRVLWSARGNPRDFQIASGGGFEDLMGMRGEGQAVVRFKDLLILLTDSETWVAQPTLDAYAFRFQKISEKVGCPYPLTAKATPLGVVFLSADLEVYVTDGFQVQALGPAERGKASRIRRILSEDVAEGKRAWATYAAQERRYELYYSTQESSEGYPVRALYFSFEDGAWLEQRFSHELSFGFDLKDTGEIVAWDSLDGVTWDELNQEWDSVGASEAARRVVAFGSGGTAFRFRSDVTNDDGEDLDVRWRSHGLNQRDQMRQVSLTRLWMDYDAPSSSNISIYTSGDRGQSFTARTQRTLTPGGSNARIDLWETARSPQFEVRWVDGVATRIGRFQADLRDAGELGGGD